MIYLKIYLKPTWSISRCIDIVDLTKAAGRLDAGIAAGGAAVLASVDAMAA
jgi:hypothetical protein